MVKNSIIKIHGRLGYGENSQRIPSKECMGSTTSLHIQIMENNTEFIVRYYVRKLPLSIPVYVTN
jgi:hypothetical protein